MKRQQDPFMWALKTAWAGVRKVSRDPLLATALVAAYLVLKVLVVSREDVPTALAVLRTAGLASAIEGSLLSAIGILAAGMLAFAVARALWLSAAHWRRRRNGMRSPGAVPVLLSWAVVLATLFASCLVTPWVALVASVIVGSCAALMVVAWRARKHSKGICKVFAVLLGAIVSGLALLAVYNITYAMWLPHEIVTYGQDGSSPGHTSDVVGYVLDDSNGWTSVLEHGGRNLKRYRNDQVVSRTVCYPRPSAVSTAATTWDLLAGRDLWKTHFRVPERKSVSCNLGPTAMITLPTRITQAKSASFSGSTSTDPFLGGTISTYTWRWGDGATTTGSSAGASHVYPSAGNLSLTLTVTDNDGRSGSVTVSIAIH